MGAYSAQADGLPQTLQEGHVSRITDFGNQLAVLTRVAQGDWLHTGIAVNCGLHQTGMKPIDGTPVCSRAFGENQNRLIVC